MSPTEVQDINISISLKENTSNYRVRGPWPESDWCCPWLWRPAHWTVARSRPGWGRSPVYCPDPPYGGDHDRWRTWGHFIRSGELYYVDLQSDVVPGPDCHRQSEQIKVLVLVVLLVIVVTDVLVLTILVIMFAGVLFSSRNNFYLVLIDFNIRDEGCLRQSDLQVVFWTTFWSIRLDWTLPTLGDIGGVEDVPGDRGLHKVVVHDGDDSVADRLQPVQVSLTPEPQPPVGPAVVDPLAPAQRHCESNMNVRNTVLSM